MNNKGIRPGAVFASVILILSLLLSGLPAIAADSAALFSDDFSSSALKGWKHSDGTVSGGSYAPGQDVINTVSVLGTQSDAIVSADVSVNIGKDESGARQGGVASLVVRGNEAGTAGYEFGLGISKAGKGYVRLYRRAATESEGLILSQMSVNIPGVDSIVKNTVYTLSVTTIGNRILCHVNGELFADVTDDTYKSGLIGVRTVGARGTFDNVRVEKVPEQKVESLTVVSHSETVSLTGKVMFELDVRYNSVYGTVRLNQDSAGVVLSGLDGKTGDKTMTVSYGGQKATFPLKVTSKFTAATLHSESFSGALSGYEDGTYTNKDYGYEYNFTVSGGRGTVAAPDTNGANLPVSVDLTVPAEKSAAWQQYSVSADMAVTGDARTATARVGQAALIFGKRTADRANYTYRVQSGGTVAVYCGSDLLYTNTAAALGLSFAVGQKVTLRADVYADHTELYYNNQLVTVLLDVTAEAVTPHAGLSSVNGSAWFDNWTVRELESKGTHAVKAFSVVSASAQTEITEIKARSLDLTDMLLRVSYIDGTTGLAALKENMISGYNKNATGTQTVTVTYAGQKKTIRFTYAPYLFYDEFSSGYSSQWKFSVDALSSYSADKGVLQITYPDGGNKASAVTGTVTGGEEWVNYAVSADVFMDPRAKIAGRARTVGLMARRTGNYYYEFRLEYSGTRLTASLYRFDKEGTTQLKKFGTSQLRDCVGETKELGLGVQYNLRLEVRGNTIKCYMDDVALPVFVDDSDRALTAGTAGIKCANNSATYDNFTVQEKSAQSIAALRLSGTVNNTVELYEGFDIDLPDYSLEIVDEDGSYDTVSLLPEMLSAFDNTAIGKQKISLTYQGVSYPAYVIISERPETLAAFEEAIRKATVADAATLKETYDSLSPYELSKIDEDLLKTYAKLQEAADRAADAGLEGYDLLLNDPLNVVTDKTWGDSIEGNSGKWMTLNGTFYQAQRPYNLVVNGWRSPDVYGEIYSISADVTMLSQDMYMGLALNIGENGYYHVRVSNKTRDTDNSVLYTVQLLKKTNNGHTVLASEYVGASDIQLDIGVKFNMRLTLKDSVLSTYINGVQVIAYDDSSNNNHYTFGECGLRISEGDGIYDNIRVYGKAMERPSEESDPIEPTYYKDDFEDEKSGESPSHWQENYEAASVVDNWKVRQKDGNLVYGTTATAARAETWLHVFEKDPVFTVKFMVGSTAANADFGFITRRSPDTAFVNIGYDAGEKKWYIASQESEAGGTETVWAEESTALKANTWYTARVEMSGTNVTVKLDGKEVIHSDNIKRTGFGRLGFFAESTAMYVDDLDCTFANGDIPQDGLLSYVVEPDVYANYMEIESTDGGDTLIGVSASTKKLSTNAGLTWTDITKDTAYAGLKTGFYPTILQLESNGRYIQILQNDNFEVQTSSDLKTWKTIGQVVPDEDILDDEGRSWTAMHINSATEIDLGNGEYRIFCPVGFRKYDQQGSVVGHFSRIYYSDDNGITWQCSETTTKDLLPGYEESDTTTWCESKVIQCADGTLRMYYSRNYLGCMQYTVSKDNGVTWEGMYQIPEMQNAMTSFAVFEDPTEDGTYYMLWINGKTTYLGSMLPRVRPCLLRSTDGQNWEFLMNCEYMTEFNSTTNGESLYQILDPSLYVSEDYVYITFGRSEREFAEDNANSHQAQRCYYLRVEKDKLSARAWDASTVADMSYPKTIEFETMPQTRFGKGDLFNTYGGTIKLTALNGKTTTEEISKNCALYEEPNMSKLGKKEISLYYVNGTKLSYEIEVVTNYTIKWNISEGGTVDPKERRIMEGETLTFTLIPDSGYTVDAVYINGEAAAVRNLQFAVENAHEDVEIDVLFREKTWLDYLGWIIGGAVVLAGGGVLIWWLIRKKKNKPSAPPPEAPAAENEQKNSSEG